MLYADTYRNNDQPWLPNQADVENFKRSNRQSAEFIAFFEKFASRECFSKLGRLHDIWIPK